MKKNIIVLISTAILASSCTSSQYHTGNGAATGAYLGAILGSAIGGISGGYRGSDIGTIVGMAGGAIVGAAIGSSADQAEQMEYEDHKRRTLERRDAERKRDNSDSGYSNNEVYVDPTNSGDDRIVFEDETAQAPINKENSNKEEINVDDLTRRHHNDNGRNKIEIRNVTVTDQNGDGILGRKEVCRVSFEIMNKGQNTIHNITPDITEMSNNSHIFISQGITVESIGAGNGVRYTASVAADNRIKDGTIVLKLSAQNNGAILAEHTLQIKTTKTR